MGETAMREREGEERKEEGNREICERVGREKEREKRAYSYEKETKG